MATTHCSILLVEDDAGIRDTVAELLASEGYSVSPVENGEEALRWLRNATRPNLIVVDLVMPVMNGAELIDALHDDAALREIPVVLMTAAAATATRPLPRADGYLSKPFDMGALLHAVAQHCVPPLRVSAVGK